MNTDSSKPETTLNKSPAQLRPDGISGRWLVVLLTLICGGHACLLVWSIVTHAPAVDEVAHLPAGISHLETGNFALYAGNPPLVRIIAASAVMPFEYRTDWRASRQRLIHRPEFQVARDFVHANQGNTQRLFVVGRLACVPISLAGLCVCFYWSRTLWGNSAGLLTALLWALSPTVLANASMLTPDTAAATAGISVCLALRAWLRNPDFTVSMILGLTAGLALLSKFTWIVVFPMTLSVVVPAVRQWHLASVSRIFTDVGFLTLAGCLALYVVNACYLFERSFTPLGQIDFVSDTLTEPAGDRHNPERRTNRFRNSWIGTVRVPLPERYVQGIDLQKRVLEQGFPSYLMGTWQAEGWWYYYLVAFAVKCPVSMLMLVTIGLISSCRHMIRSCRNQSLRGTRSENPEDSGHSVSTGDPLLLWFTPVAVLFLVSSQTGYNHHFRYVLPVIPFLLIAAGRAWLVTRARPVITLLVGWQLISVLSIGPHWHSYFNEPAGGPRKGHAWLIDSNIDWGEDLLALKQWQDAHPDRQPLFATLYTMFEPADIGLKYRVPQPLLGDDRSGDHAPVTFRPPENPSLHPAAASGDLPPGWYAISVTLLRGRPSAIPDGEGGQIASGMQFTDFLKSHQPDEMIGYSIYLYHISADDG